VLSACDGQPSGAAAVARSDPHYSADNASDVSDVETSDDDSGRCIE